MIAVIFEVWPADGRRESYLEHAARPRPELEKIDGFVSVEQLKLEPGMPVFAVVKSVAFDRHNLSGPLRAGRADDDLIDA